MIGIDYSETAVKFAKNKNQNNTNESKVEIMLANVEDLPFKDNFFTLVTAFSNTLSLEKV